MSRCFIYFGLLLASLVTSSAAPPGWWASRGATATTAANDNGPVNQGQLKQFTQKAVLEFNARIPGGAGPELNELVIGWVQAYQAGNYNAANPLPADFEVMNSGQLKWIASKIHTRLVFAKYETTPPAWLTQNAATDGQLANLGQLKTVFNFDLTAPAGQLPAWWQKFYFDGQSNSNPGSNPGSNPNTNPSSDPDGDGMSNTTENVRSLDPTKKDNPKLLLEVTSE